MSTRTVSRSAQNRGTAAPTIPGVSVDHYENFPVASVLCPPRLRPAVVAIYHFARTADDIADEGDAPAGHRLAQLAEFRKDLDLALQGRADSRSWPAVFRALEHRIAEFDLPAAPLHALLDAFEQDVRNPAYGTREQVLDYCRRSANPIGHLLLHLYGLADDPAARAQSDQVCTALQLINFWQDLSVDGPRGRIYVPQEDLLRHGCTTAQLLAREDSPELRQLVADLCRWADELMRQGQALALRLPGRAGWELRLVVQGGLRVLEKIAAMHHATIRHRPTLSAGDLPRLLWRAWRMGSQRAAAR